jgi:hypothetical protein
MTEHDLDYVSVHEWRQRHTIALSKVLVKIFGGS